MSDEAFWGRVNKTETCWLWTGTINDQGYGISRRHFRAHRIAYELLVGPIPDGLQLDHLCRVRNCVNPDHLEPVTARTNTRRGVGFAAQRAAQTHCKREHEFTEENTYIRRNGTRLCRTCAKEAENRRPHRKNHAKKRLNGYNESRLPAETH